MPTSAHIIKKGQVKHGKAEEEVKRGESQQVINQVPATLIEPKQIDQLIKKVGITHNEALKKLMFNYSDDEEEK